jgi:hypothetical protein
MAILSSDPGRLTDPSVDGRSVRLVGVYPNQTSGDHLKTVRSESPSPLMDRCRATLWMTTWAPKGVTVGDDGRLGLDLRREESVASPA